MQISAANVVEVGKERHAVCEIVTVTEALAAMVAHVKTWDIPISADALRTGKELPVIFVSIYLDFKHFITAGLDTPFCTTLCLYCPTHCMQTGKLCSLESVVKTVQLQR